MEMANDIEKTLTSELPHCKFDIQLDETTFESLDILMAYMRILSSSLKGTVDEFLLANYLETDSISETTFSCL